MSAGTILFVARSLSPSLMAKFSVAIVGGGIGGVTLALALSKFPDVHFELYEAAGTFEEIGAGVGITIRAVSALTDLGLVQVDQLEAICTALTRPVVLRKADVSPEGHDFAVRRFPPSARGAGSYRRHELLSLFVSLLPETYLRERVHFRKRLIRYEQDHNTITLHFADGSTASCDVLIGADGIKSPTRYCLYAEKAELEKDGAESADKAALLRYAAPRWSGMVAYRGLVASNEVEKELGHPHRCTSELIMHCGKDAHLVVFPVARGKMINIVAFVSKPVIRQHKEVPSTTNEREWPADMAWVQSVDPQEMLDAYDGFEDQALVLLKHIKSPSRWAIHELDPLPFYTHGRVALLGDAAHATQPHQGQGANQSIEDAFALALILSSPHTTKDNIPHALRAYERARLKRANDVIRLSSEAGRIHQFNKAPEYEDLEALKIYVEGDWNSWVFQGSLKNEVEEAIAWMVDELTC